MSDRFDIVLPTRGRAHTIGYSIQSVLNQTFGDFDLHVVGDGRDAATEAVIAAITDPRVHYHPFPKGMGFGYAHRNTILRSTSAPLIAYMTDDDLLFPDHLERGLCELRGSAVGLVAFRAANVAFPDVLEANFFAFDWRAGPLSSFLRNWFIGSANLVHHRWVFEKVGYWDETLFRFGDREFYNRVRGSSAGSRFVDTITLLRFFATHWDKRYGLLDAPPQKKYLARLQDARWVASLRSQAVPGSRSLAVRRRQWRDLIHFARQSGPKFVRFSLHRIRSRLRNLY